MNLSKRLKAVAGLVSPGHRLADIGTDHAYVPIYLVESGKVPRAIAMDINQGPLKKAEENIKNHHLEALIQLRLSDGLLRLQPDEADTVLIAGMGGNLMSRIIADGQNQLKNVSELVLQPQSEIREFRHFLHDFGYRICEEDMLIDEGKYYVMFRVEKGVQHYENEAEYAYGKLLLQRKHPVLRQYIEKELRNYETILKHLTVSDSAHAMARHQVLLKKSALGKEALKYYDMP